MRAVIGLVSINCRSRRPALTSKLISAGPRRSTALLAANRCGESWTSTTSESQRTRFSVPCDDRISTSKFCDCRVPANAMSESLPVAVPLNDARPCSVTGIRSWYPAADKIGCHSPRLVVFKEIFSAEDWASLPEARTWVARVEAANSDNSSSSAAARYVPRACAVRGNWLTVG